MAQRFTKRAPTVLVVAVEFAKYPLNAGETVVASNARGNLGLMVRDSTGADVTATLSEGSPGIVGGTQVAFWLKAGVVGQVYTVEVRAPTSDEELLSDVQQLEILP